ncbi:unnamed protein product [Mytilus edulis]|uniref:Uncharacterized protein n=1 Tax=Mytilus edulis TaxID=6550 RepID=A0A8S3QZ45_MYTED|nr:unnamed protein product [Mytilus edulis]
MANCELNNLFNTSTTDGLSAKFLANFAENVMMDNYFENWKRDVNNMPKLRTFKLLHSNFEAQSYVRSVLSRQQRSAIARMRSDTYPLEIEKGRYRGTPVEDEKHFLIQCPQYLSKRNTFFADFHIRTSINLSILNDDEILILLLTTNSKFVSNYIIDITQFREQLI